MQGEENGPVSRNLRKKISFHREKAKISSHRENFFLIRVTPEWNELRLKVNRSTKIKEFTGKTR